MLEFSIFAKLQEFFRSVADPRSHPNRRGRGKRSTKKKGPRGPLYPFEGDMQTSGGCAVAEGMPATAIAINFVSNGTSITKVEYVNTFDCGDPLLGGGRR